MTRQFPRELTLIGMHGSLTAGRDVRPAVRRLTPFWIDAVPD